MLTFGVLAAPLGVFWWRWLLFFFVGFVFFLLFFFFEQIGNEWRSRLNRGYFYPGGLKLHTQGESRPGGGSAIPAAWVFFVVVFF